jgi:hypothetical protein
MQPTPPDFAPLREAGNSAGPFFHEMVDDFFLIDRLQRINEEFGSEARSGRRTTSIMEPAGPASRARRDEIAELACPNAWS